MIHMSVFAVTATMIHMSVFAVTGASFILFCTSSSAEAKCSIVEDGVMVQMPRDLFLALKRSFHACTNYSMSCGQHCVTIQWTDGLTSSCYVNTRYHTFIVGL